MPPEAGDKIGHYRIVRLLGEGGMGRVYEAIHDQIERRAAIKVLHAQFAHNSEAFTRFLNEARAVNIVQHPGVVNVYEFGQTDDGCPYIVMEFLEGETLESRLQHVGKMSLGAMRIARQVASALVAAHSKHVVHRDLKPSNVMLVPDSDMPGGERARVVDFGIAKLSTDHSAGHYQTRAGAILGTPSYMAPEQCRGAGEVTDKSDVYSLGVMIYQMLVGRPPFVADGEGEVMGMHMFKTPPSLHSLEPTLPLDLVDLVHSMLEKEPDRRPNMVAVARELDRIGQRLSGQMQAVSPEMEAMAAAPKPPGPLTLPVDGQGNPIAAPPAPPADAAAPSGPMEGNVFKSGPHTPTLGLVPKPDPAAPGATPAPPSAADESPKAESPSAGVSTTAVISAKPHRPQSSAKGKWIAVGIALVGLLAVIFVLAFLLTRRNPPPVPAKLPPAVVEPARPSADLGTAVVDQAATVRDLSAAAPVDAAPPTKLGNGNGNGNADGGSTEKAASKKQKKKKHIKGMRNAEIEYLD